MSPYEVKLLVHIDSCLDPIPFKKTKLLQDTLFDFVKRELIEVSQDSLSEWKITEHGRAVCIKFYGVNESNIKVCKECGQLIE
jgi:hypothetical protein